MVSQTLTLIHMHVNLIVYLTSTQHRSKNKPREEIRNKNRFSLKYSAYWRGRGVLISYGSHFDLVHKSPLKLILIHLIGYTKDYLFLNQKIISM